MPKIVFSETRTVNDGSNTTFEAGQTYDLPTASCERWIRRGVARYAEGSGPGPDARAGRTSRPTLNDMTLDLGGGDGADKGDGEGNQPAAIPENWTELAWVDLLALAKQFDADVRSKDDAIAAVELEIERRKKA